MELLLVFNGILVLSYFIFGRKRKTQEKDKHIVVLLRRTQVLYCIEKHLQRRDSNNLIWRNTLLALALNAAIFHSTAYAGDVHCSPVNFMEVSLSRSNQNPAIVSIIATYPNVSYSDDTNMITFSSGREVLFESQTDRPGAEILQNPTIGDQFRYIYPLEFNLLPRTEPWHDPGRVRNDPFMRALYFDTKGAAKETLTLIKAANGRASFNVTERNDVACQLQAVLRMLGDDYPEVFENVGGSFNWRNISGTDRLSVHSFGAAIDVNSQMGGYWKWSGERAGAVGAFNNQIPQGVVEAFETYGFIWGGKWHHYDGMHFEYRPELIVYSRLVALN